MDNYLNIEIEEVRNENSRPFSQNYSLNTSVHCQIKTVHRFLSKFKSEFSWELTNKNDLDGLRLVQKRFSIQLSSDL
jgi:hypothetical protein